MPESPGRILVVDDDAEMCDVLLDALREEEHEGVAAYSGEEALAKLAQEDFDVVVADLQMKGMKGLELLRHIKGKYPDVVVLIITAFGTIESAVEAIKGGAFHYLTKPFKTAEFKVFAGRALQERELLREVARLRQVVEERYQFHNLLGKSRAMQELFRLIERVADVPSYVLIAGESGVGKELVARAIHYGGNRRERNFVPVNCAAIPEQLLESELFGHVRGAFTGAHADKKGLFEEAQGGTLLLDEVSEVPPLLQAKLLRALEDGEIRRVGATKSQKIDVRIIAATNRDLMTEVAAGKFREDLFYRLNVIQLRIPPLRERSEDIPMLAHHFLKKHAAAAGKTFERISETALRVLVGYAWPGNVRELENAVERAVALGQGPELRVIDLPDTLQDRDVTVLETAVQQRFSLEELEREYILRVLSETGGNKQRAAQVLGIDRKTLYRKLEQYEPQSPARA